MKLASVPAVVSMMAVGLTAFSVAAQSQVVITDWTFENQPVTGAPPYNNSPTPAVGSGTAIVLGMDNNYGTPGQSFASADILADPGSSDASGQNAWRIRGQGQPTASTANGWSSLAPQYTQGGQFDVSTIGFQNIHASFDWQPTNKGVEDIELQYNANVNNTATWVNAGLFSNTVAGGVWNNNNIVDLSALGALVNNPNFGIRIVSAFHPGQSTYFDTTGSVLNNSSGNIRVDNVKISGTALPTATPEPGSVALLFSLSIVGAGFLKRRRSFRK